MQENAVLSGGGWTGEILWDAAESTTPGLCHERVSRPLAPLVVDLNDPHILHGATVRMPVNNRFSERVDQKKGRQKLTNWMVSEMEAKIRQAKERAKKEFILPLPCDADDPFNLSLVSHTYICG